MTLGEPLPFPQPGQASGHENAMGLLEGLTAVCQRETKNNRRAMSESMCAGQHWLFVSGGSLRNLLHLQLSVLLAFKRTNMCLL